MEVDASVDFSRIDDTVKVMLAQTMRARPRACPRQEDKLTCAAFGRLELEAGAGVV